MDYKEEYKKWSLHVTDKDARAELEQIDEDNLEDAFYRNLTFGTGGLRGIIGMGTNRMNVYTVAKASQGLSNYINSKYSKGPSIAIAYDSRLKSKLFCETAAEVFAANGIKVYIYSELMPTPCLSYAVRELKCSAGIVITASHNPYKYNGYKVYNYDGCQITVETAAIIQAEIDKLDIFDDVRKIGFSDACRKGLIEYIEEKVCESFVEEEKKQSVLFGDEVDRDVAIVYSPLNGTGLEPVTSTLRESGFTNIVIVKEQEQPNGFFPTCPYPNPEVKEAMELGIKYCEHIDADLMLATDPDADRCGIAVRSSNGYQLLTGNEVGLLLLDFICSQRIKHGEMPRNPIFIKTIVTTDLAEKIAKSYGVNTINVLTGFKYIGEMIGKMESLGRESDFIFGFEESYGYLTGTYVRDKDAVNATFMISEMFAYYKMRGISLFEKLQDIYDEYGYTRNTLHSYEFEGPAGMKKMQTIMAAFRKGVDTIGGQRVLREEDYKECLYDLPSSDVLKYYFENGSVVVRPSGTEPKLKAYISITSNDSKTAEIVEKNILDDLEQRFFQ